MNKEVCSIVILYQPDVDVFNNLLALAQQSDYVLAINNGFIDEEYFYGLISTGVENIKLINLNRNEGIAHALNVGIEMARKLGYRWVSTFDQDSKVSDRYFEGMFSCYEKCKDMSIAVIAPVYYNRSTDSMVTYVNKRYEVINSSGCKFVDTTITSGNIIDLYLVLDVKPFREELFIDQVDNDFNLRIIDSGMFILETDAILSHNLGNQKSHHFFGKRPVSNNHSAFRRYFISRNRVYMYRHYFRRHRKWVIYDMKHAILEIIKIILFEDDKVDKLRKSVLGLAHGIIFDIDSFRELNYAFTKNPSR